MSTGSFEFNRGCTNLGSGTVNLFATSELIITSIIISACNTADVTSTVDKTLSLQLSGGGEIYKTDDIIIPNGSGKNDYEFKGINYRVPQGATLNISRNVSSSDIKTYWQATDRIIVNGGYLTSAKCFDMIINLSWNSWWQVGGAYPYINSSVKEFKYYEKDENGYPYAANVWKLDTQNDGYPWLFNFDDVNKFNTIYLKTETGLQACNIYLKTETGLQACNILKKEE